MKYISQNNSIGANKDNNKRCFSANGFSLLPLALRPRLFCSVVTAIVSLAIGLFVCSNPTYATDPFLNATVSNNITLDLKPISTTGTFAKSDTASSTISATTNYFAGYTLGIAASSNGADAANLLQISGEGNEQTIIGRISSIGTVEGVTSAGITEQAFSGNSNIQYNNTWGYTLTKLSTSESTNYLPAPTTTAAITLDTTSTANPETANNYNMAIGARVGTDIPKGSYTNTFVIIAVANPIPYEIAFDKGNAGEGEVSGLPTTLNNSTMAESITLPNTKPTRSGYAFAGWCSVMPVVSGNADSCSGDIYYQDGTGDRTFIINQTGSNTDITLYAMWQEVHNITFTAGNNIDTIIIADSSDKWRPYYITANGTKTFSNVPVGRKYAVTVVPVANHILDSWTSTSSSTNNLANPTLLTTMYTVGTTNEILTATGVAADYTDPTKSYTAMKDFTLSNCTATGSNVTDERDGKSYTVAKFGNYCYMLSNLRLDSGIELETTYSDIKSGGVTYTDPSTGQSVTATTFTTPTEAWTNNSQNYYCKAIVKHYNQGSGDNYSNEYYYNWYAARANPYECVNPTTTTNSTRTNDNLALGSVCPKNWTLPTYSDITAATLWDDGNNPGLMAAFGAFESGSRHWFGNRGYWWSSARSDDRNACFLYLHDASATLDRIGYKIGGQSVRCMRSS